MPQGLLVVGHFEAHIWRELKAFSAYIYRVEIKWNLSNKPTVVV